VATNDKPRTPRIQGRVRVASGPWELEERWWSEDRTERDYWDVELEDGALYRIYRDRRSERWFADGVYD
jgi:protein ImuB